VLQADVRDIREPVLIDPGPRHTAGQVQKDLEIVRRPVVTTKARGCTADRLYSLLFLVNHTDSHGMEQRLPRVLVVDDEDAVLKFAARALGLVGYEVVVASDGWDALRVVDAQRPFDLFVIDVMMPKMRGDELAQRLHRRGPDIKVLYCTGHKDQLFQARPVLGKTEAVVEKPVTVSEFRDAVSLLLFGHTRGPAR
jgi:CheY-like chemotaxis protein